jgi:hypothetical protein
MATYSKQTWTDGVTQANAARMSHIEDGIAAAQASADALGTSSTNGTPNTVAKYDAEGNLKAAAAVDPTDVTILSQVQSMVAGGVGSGGTGTGVLDLASATATTGQLDATTKLANLQDAVEAFSNPQADPVGGSLAERRPTGALTGAQATNTDELVPLAQVRDLIGAGGGTGGTAGGTSAPKVKTGLPLSSTTDGTFKAAPAELGTSGLKTGDRVRCFLWVAYRGVAAAGIKWRIAQSAVALTNRLTNGDFNSDITGWRVSAIATLTRDTATVKSGAGSLKVTVNTAGNVSVWSEYVACEPGDVYSAAIQCRRGTATARTVRCDISFGAPDATDAQGVTGVVSSPLGEPLTPTTTGWTRLIRDSAHVSGAVTGSAAAPAGTGKVRLRMQILNAAVGDVFYFDEAQLEPGDPIVAYGNTGGGASALSVQGDAEAYPATGTITAATTPRVPTVIASAADVVSAQAISATVSASMVWAVDVEVGGTGLVDQAVGFEFAQLAANATATTIVAAHATWAKAAAA